MTTVQDDPMEDDASRGEECPKTTAFEQEAPTRPRVQAAAILMKRRISERERTTARPRQSSGRNPQASSCAIIPRALRSTDARAEAPPPQQQHPPLEMSAPSESVAFERQETRAQQLPLDELLEMVEPSSLAEESELAWNSEAFASEAPVEAPIQGAGIVHRRRTKQKKKSG